MTDRTVMTVLGPISTDELGITMAHKHLLSNFEMHFVDRSEAAPQRDADRPIEMSMLSDLRRCPSRRPGTTSSSTTRMPVSSSWNTSHEPAERPWSTRRASTSGAIPQALQRISRATGLHVVTATGFYVESAHPEWIAAGSVDEVARFMVGEFVNGIGDTGIRPRMIGEIGLSGRPKGGGLARVGAITAAEEKVLRAAGRASLETGLAVSVQKTRATCRWAASRSAPRSPRPSPTASTRAV